MFLAGVPKPSPYASGSMLFSSVLLPRISSSCCARFFTRPNRTLKMSWKIWFMCVFYIIPTYCICVYIYISYVCVCVFFKVFDGYHECSCILVAIDNNMNLNWLLETYTWCIRCWKDMKEYFRIIRNTMYMFNVQYYLMHCLYNEQTNGTWDQKWENRCSGTHRLGLKQRELGGPLFTLGHCWSRIPEVIRPTLEPDIEGHAPKGLFSFIFHIPETHVFFEKILICLLPIPNGQGQDKTQARLRSMVLSTRTSLRCTSRSELCPRAKKQQMCWFSVSCWILMMVFSWNFVVLRIWCSFNVWSFVGIANWTIIYDSANSSNWDGGAIGTNDNEWAIFTISFVELPEGT